MVDFFGRELSKERREKLKSTGRLHVDFAFEEIFLAGPILPDDFCHTLISNFKIYFVNLKFRNICQGKFLVVSSRSHKLEKLEKEREEKSFEGSTGATG